MATAPAPVRILIVEDEFIVAEDLARMLQSLGYDVAGPAATTDKALKIVASANPDLVFMDIAGGEGTSLKILIAPGEWKEGRLLP